MAQEAHSQIIPKIDIEQKPAKRPRRRLPDFIKVKANFSPNYFRVKDILARNDLHSVCQEASCPNIRECFGEGTATFMILGANCTRGCRFCDVKTAVPLGLDREEPKRLARTVGELNLRQVVITSVTRDDLRDGGAEIFAETIRQLRLRDPEVKVEVLIPDMRGDEKSVATVLEAGPDVFAHNVETVARLYRRVRPGAQLKRSLDILRQGHEFHPRPVIKTGFMVGLGETLEEITELFKQIRETGTQIVTVGQYLSPSEDHLEEVKFYHPDEYKEISRIGYETGFEHVEAGPLVRSSYKAFSQSKSIIEKQEKGHDAESR